MDVRDSAVGWASLRDPGRVFETRVESSRPTIRDPLGDCSRSRWVSKTRPHTHQVKEFDPERIVLSAQAEGLGKIAKQRSSLKGSFGMHVRTAPTGPRQTALAFPGLRPGLTEPAFQADDLNLMHMGSSLRDPGRVFETHRERLQSPSTTMQDDGLASGAA